MHAIGAARSALGWGYHLLGKQEEACMHIEAGIKALNDLGILYHMSRLYFVLGMVHFASGNLSGARMNMEKAISLSQNCDEKHFEAISKIWLGRILGREKGSEFDKVAKDIYEGIKVLSELRLRPFSAQGYLFLAEHFADRGQRKKAVHNLNRAKKMFQEMGMDYWLTKTQEVSERLNDALATA